MAKQNQKAHKNVRKTKPRKIEKSDEQQKSYPLRESMYRRIIKQQAEEPEPAPKKKRHSN